MAKEEVLGRDERLFVQHARAEHIFLLLDGNLKFYGSAGAQQILIGQLYSPNSPVGLSAFHPPYRHEVEARVNSESATILKWKRAELFDFLASKPELAINFFGFINTQGQRLIEESSELFLSMTGAGKSLKPDIILTKKEQSPLEQDEDDATLFLLQSPFFEVFEEKFLRVLAAHLQRYQYASGDVLHLQGGACSGIDILESGEVQFSRNNVTTQGEQTVWFRSISTPGYLLGSSGVLNQISDMTVTVSKDAVVYHLPIEAIRSLENGQPEFGRKLQERVSWLLMNQLRMVQTRLLSAEFVEEAIVVTNLIENNQSKLSLDSPLHSVPHLLKEKLTTKKGLEILHQVELQGMNHERNLASLSLDNLQKTQKETEFFHGLMGIYSSVVSASADSSTGDLQISCNEAAHKAFSIPSINLKGYNNLPEKPGHIFIYNHLLNDPYYTLPNQFQITLDAHYLSALLYEKYGKPALRIVRIGREAE
ncbi:MAG: cyclic nucleotide-binding domain-containing protein, partial [Cyclobacteriaceae bacterium]